MRRFSPTIRIADDPHLREGEPACRNARVGHGHGRVTLPSHPAVAHQRENVQPGILGLRGAGQASARQRGLRPGAGDLLVPHTHPVVRAARLSQRHIEENDSTKRAAPKCFLCGDRRQGLRPALRILVPDQPVLSSGFGRLGSWLAA